MFADSFKLEDQYTLNDFVDPFNLHQSSSQSQNKYIEQFLEQGVLETLNLQNQISVPQKQKFSTNQEDQNELSPRNSFRRKSKFHNYQKHLIITLRKTVKMDIKQEGICNQVVRQLWSSFCSSRIYNKSLLRILFGEQMIEQQLNVNLFRKQGFKSIIEKYNADQIIQAQHMLRRLVLSHFQQNSLDSLLNSRKLPDQTKNLFKKYIMEFIEQLRQGNVMKRLPKSRKAQILTQG